MTFATINGNRLRYRAEGDGPLGIFGHGLLGSIEQLDEYMPALTTLYGRSRLAMYDARGHGQSDGPADPAAYTWATLGEDMAALVAELGEERAILGGASMGAASALWVAIERPERCRALVLVMPPALGGSGVQSTEEKRAIQVLEMLAAAVQNFGVEKTIELARNMPGFAANPDSAEEQERWLRAQNPLALTHAIRGVVAAPFHDPEAYRRVRVPTLVLAHEGDGLHPARAAQLLGEKVPDCTVHIAPDPEFWRTHPEEFLAEVNRFLDRVG